MYCNHYGFSEKPFNVTPDPRFLFLTPDHRETLAAIVYGIQERRGFVTVIGEVGTGKTTLLNAAVDPMDERTRVAFIFNMDLTFNEMLNMALHEWGLSKDNESVSKVDAIQRLRCFATDQLKNGRDLSHLTLSNYYLATEISPVLVVQNNETQNSKQVSTFNENDLSENQVKDKEKQDPSAPETRAEAKDKPNLSTPVKTKTKVLKIKIKKGDTLFRIITQKFGGYDGTMLAKVLRKNPGITDPDKILAGQEIRLPADKMGDRIYYR
jgi:uncharacterized protein YegJ (DUF2314 family)